MGGVSTAGRDPGLQPERTRLAWRRTTLSAAVAAVLAVRTALRDGSATGVVMGAVCCALWLGFLGVAHHRIRTLSAGTPPPAFTPRHAAAAVLCAVATAVCAAVLVV
ncbi:protein of unknown function [Streptomyces sp. 1222.5]|uniref:DUF202 domain-containing protein n=1 Tax=unclassified Streptomyces TaxID=2593676 RepID=UPI00089B9A5F|nr:DUF202 domain-containing protein [Streptomyces sp. 1222.5]PKW06793.1 uncharacterized protein DUF202 [Streptomyces sp. 5112.2]SED04946.1 protein of unknown function [Streptomyces sp. 1222.5]